MRFICPDIDGTVIIEQLFKDNNAPNELIVEDGTTLEQSNDIYIQSQGNIYNYANPTMKKYYQKRNFSPTYQTIAQIATWAGITINTTNLSSTFTAKTFQWMISRIRDIKSSIFYTIFSDRGIYLALPQTYQYSNQIAEYTLLGSSLNKFNNMTMEGETATDYYVSLPFSDTVRPSSLDSTIKTQIMNMEKSKNDYIYIRTGKPANPLDYVLYNGNNYIIISQKRDKEQNLYVAVREVKTAYTFSGADISIMSMFEPSKMTEGQMVNGRITPTVASNHLTLTLQTMNGSTPSISNPVYIRINNEIRTITSALSVTLSAGTNWFNSGGSELATKEKDYFAYIGYNTTDGVVLGFSSMSYPCDYSEFSTTTTNERYLAVSNRTTAASTDYYCVIGRFAATLSAGAGYTWTIPTYTAINLIQYPIWTTRWLTWQPIYSASGSMTYTSVATDYVRYKIDRQIIYIILRSSGTTGGTASTQLLATQPHLPAGAGGGNNTLAGCAVNDNGLKSGAVIIQAATLAAGCIKYDNSNWGLGASRQIFFDHFYSLI